MYIEIEIEVSVSQRYEGGPWEVREERKWGRVKFLIPFDETRLLQQLPEPAEGETALQPVITVSLFRAPEVTTHVVLAKQ